MPRTILLSAFLVLSALLFATPAWANATVQVQVQSASGKTVDGQVSLTNTEDVKKRFACATSRGRCTIPGVPGGRYTVVFRPSKGKPSTPRKVMIPPSGNVTLRVAAN